MTSTITRKEMKEPDRFQQVATQAASWIAARRRQVIAAGVSVIGALAIAAILSAVQASRVARAGAAASDLLAAVGGEISAVPLPGVPGPFYPSDDARQRAVVAAADQLVAKYPRTSAAALALLAKGDAHLRLHEWDAAKAAYEKFLASADRKDSLRFGALEGIGIAEEAKGELATAGQGYERLSREAPAFADRADLDRARVLAAAGRPDEARKILAAFGEKHKESLLTGEASSQLARLGAK